MLTAQQLHKTYSNNGNKTHVLKNVSLDIEQGEFACIIGRSGSGKSTLLNILSTLTDADGGTVTYKGELLGDISEKRLNKLRLNEFSVIFQFHHLFPYLDAIENVLLPFLSRMRPVSAKMKQQAIAALGRVGLNGKEHRLPSQLSGGEQQRVAIARALVNNPTVLFADEPTGSLDKSNGDGIIKLLQELNKDGLTILMVTHQQEYASIANQIIEMEDGKIKRIHKQSTHTKVAS